MNLLKERSYWWWKAAPKPWHPWALALATAGLGWAGWHPSPLTFLIFIMWVPLLWAAEMVMAQPERYRKPGRNFWAMAYTALLFWNLATTWWIYNSTFAGAAGAIILNAGLMSIPWLVYVPVRQRFGVVQALVALMLAWLTFEYIHLRWDLTWPWLTLGNAFAQRPDWVQWYEWTGALGGSAWVWWLNGAMFLGLASTQSKSLAKAVCWSTAICLLFITTSYCIMPWRLLPPEGEAEVVVVQPNIDPYTEKFPGTERFIPYAQQLDRAWQLSQPLLDANTRWLLWPETTIDGAMDEQGINTESVIRGLRERLAPYPNLSLVVGATTVQFYKDSEAPGGARHDERLGHHNVFNTALHLRADSGVVGIYHKSKLVPGVEGMPYPALLGPLTALVIDLGGTAGGLGRQMNRSVFKLPKEPGPLFAAIAPAVCYESIFGDFMADFVREGAGFIGIITNDAWWGNTPGHVQHFHMARLRAIETRRWVARAANTGISGYIDPLGQVIEQTEYGVQAARKHTIALSTRRTWYVQTGDWFAMLLALFMGIWFWKSHPRR